MEGAITVSVETNKELVRRFYEAIGREDYDALKEFAHPDFVFYPQIDTPFYGAEGLVESEKKNFDAFLASGCRFNRCSLKEIKWLSI